MFPTPDIIPEGSYDPSYYANQVPGALLSAQVVLAKLFELYQPESIIDVGCGQGGWLAAADELGIRRLVGLDGPWVKTDALLTNRMEFIGGDLEQDMPIDEKFDLCVSVEVAEHLSARRAPSFVSMLCSAADVVLFSAAIPHQGGVNHINEQWQSLWAGIFNENGYECYDIFRPTLWGDDNVDPWYRQNLLLYVRRSNHLESLLRSHLLSLPQMDVVHPAIYEGNLEKYRRQLERPSLRFCSRIFVRWLRNKLALNNT